MRVVAPVVAHCTRVARCRARIARDAGFGAPLIDRNVPQDDPTLDRPADGVCFVRAQAVADDGDAGAFSEPEGFTVEEPSNPL